MIAVETIVGRKFRGATSCFPDRVCVLQRLRLVRGEEPGADRPISNPEICGDLLEALTLLPQMQNTLAIYQTFRAAQLLTVRPRVPNPSTNPFPY